MSRDHYRGVPKSIPIVKGSDGKVQPLSKLNKASGSTLFADEFITKRKDNLTYKTVYANINGNDSIGDGSVENPYKTFVKCLDILPDNIRNTIWYIDISNLGTEVVEDVVKFPAISSSQALEPNFNAPITSPEYSVYESAVNVIAEPIVIDTVTAEFTYTQETTGWQVITDSSKSWTPGEHKGRILHGTSLSAAAIYDNSADTLYICANTISGDLKIVEPSATLKYGSASVADAFIITGLQAPVTFTGIRWDRNSGSTAGSLYMEGTGSVVYMNLCWFEEGLYATHGGYLVIGYCVIKNGYGQDGTGVTIRNTLFQDSSFSAHGSGGAGLDYFLNVRFENMSGILGHGGNSEPEIGFAWDRCSVSGSASTGLLYSGSTTCSIRRTEFIDCGGSAIAAQAPGRLRLLTVSGTGNSGYGLSVTNGAHVEVTSAINLSGDLGDFKVGTLSAETWTSFNSGFTNRVDVDTTSGTLARVYSSASY